MDRVPPLRSTVASRRVGLRAAVVVSCLFVVSAVLFGAGFAAADGWLSGDSSDAERPVSLARSGAEPATPNWIDGGPVVPLLLILTAGMLVGGCGLLMSRCRSVSEV